MGPGAVGVNLNLGRVWNAIRKAGTSSIPCCWFSLQSNHSTSSLVSLSCVALAEMRDQKDRKFPFRKPRCHSLPQLRIWLLSPVGEAPPGPSWRIRPKAQPCCLSSSVCPPCRVSQSHVPSSGPAGRQIANRPINTALSQPRLGGWPRLDSLHRQQRRLEGRLLGTQQPCLHRNRSRFSRSFARVQGPSPVRDLRCLEDTCPVQCDGHGWRRLCSCNRKDGW